MDKNTALDQTATNELEASLEIENPAKLLQDTELAITPGTHPLDLNRDAGQTKLHVIEAYLYQSQTELSAHEVWDWFMRHQDLHTFDAREDESKLKAFIRVLEQGQLDLYVGAQLLQNWREVWLERKIDAMETLVETADQLIYGLADVAGLPNKDQKSCQRLEEMIEQYYQIYPGPREHRKR